MISTEGGSSKSEAFGFFAYFNMLNSETFASQKFRRYQYIKGMLFFIKDIKELFLSHFMPSNHVVRNSNRDARESKLRKDT